MQNVLPFSYGCVSRVRVEALKVPFPIAISLKVKFQMWSQEIQETTKNKSKTPML